ATEDWATPARHEPKASDGVSWCGIRARGVLEDHPESAMTERREGVAERVGFEPTCPFGQDAFEAPPLRPLRYLSVRSAWLKWTFNYIHDSKFEIHPHADAARRRER